MKTKLILQVLKMVELGFNKSMTELQNIHMAAQRK